MPSGWEGRQYKNQFSGGQTVNATSGDVANATATATLAAVAGRTAYISGFEITGSGATAAAAVKVDVTGLAGGTISFIYCAAAGVAVANVPLIVAFPSPLPASAVAQAIAVVCPALGTGAAHNIVTAHGFYL
jgi:hypothetical protein